MFYSLGIRTRFGYFKDLGVKSLALGSIFKKDDFSAIVDHKDVDPKLGTLPDVESFLKFAKVKGIFIQKSDIFICHFFKNEITESRECNRVIDKVDLLKPVPNTNLNRVFLSS